MVTWLQCYKVTSLQWGTLNTQHEQGTVLTLCHQLAASQPFRQAINQIGCQRTSLKNVHVRHGIKAKADSPHAKKSSTTHSGVKHYLSETLVWLARRCCVAATIPRKRGCPQPQKWNDAKKAENGIPYSLPNDARRLASLRSNVIYIFTA